MDNHIHFSAIECRFLEYSNRRGGYICRINNMLLPDTKLCMLHIAKRQLKEAERLMKNG